MVMLLVMFMLTENVFYSSMLLLSLAFSMIMLLDSFGNWMNFIICMIYLGGIMVLFMYIAAISPNKEGVLNLHLIPMIMVMYPMYLYYKSFSMNLNYLKMLFFSPMMFKFWMLMLVLIIVVLLVISDLSSQSYKSFRSM